MKILFIIANTTVEPLGIMYLSAELKKYNHQVNVYDFDTYYNLCSYIDEIQPEFIGLSMTTGNHVQLLNIARYIKVSYPNIRIIAGGTHVTYFPSVIDEKCIDYAFKGEADYALSNFINNFDKFNLKKDHSFTKLPDNLDDLPFPDRSNVYKYPKYYNNRMRNILTSRGCPYSCAYCYNSVYKELYKGQKIVRYRSAGNVIDECKELIKQYPTKMIFFADDEFSININRLEEMHDLYINEVNLPFHCQLRIDILTEERIKLLKSMGCYSLTFAIESGNEHIRKFVLGRNISNKQIIDGCKLLKKYKIKFRAENMLSLPNESWKQLMETVDLNIKVKPTYAWASLFQPFPNTPLGEYCRKNGLFDGDIDNINIRFTEDTVLRMSPKNRHKVINMQRLFSIVVAFPILTIILSLLLQFKMRNFYTQLRETWKRYSYKQLFKGI